MFSDDTLESKMPTLDSGATTDDDYTDDESDQASKIKIRNMLPLRTRAATSHDTNMRNILLPNNNQLANIIKNRQDNNDNDNNDDTKHADHSASDVEQKMTTMTTNISSSSNTTNTTNGPKDNPYKLVVLRAMSYNMSKPEKVKAKAKIRPITPQLASLKNSQTVTNVHAIVYPKSTRVQGNGSGQSQSSRVTFPVTRAYSQSVINPRGNNNNSSNLCVYNKQYFTVIAQNMICAKTNENGGCGYRKFVIFDRKYFETHAMDSNGNIKVTIKYVHNECKKWKNYFRIQLGLVAIENIGNNVYNNSKFEKFAEKIENFNYNDCGFESLNKYNETKFKTFKFGTKYYYSCYYNGSNQAKNYSCYFGHNNEINSLTLCYKSKEYNNNCIKLNDTLTMEYNTFKNTLKFYKNGKILIGNGITKKHCYNGVIRMKKNTPGYTFYPAMTCFACDCDEKKQGGFCVAVAKARPRS